MSADLFTRLERSYAILKAAEMLRGRGGAFGIIRNEARQQADDDARDNRNGAQGTSNPAAAKGRWCAYVSRIEAYHDDPTEAVRDVEKQCAALAVGYLRDERKEWEQKIADANAALATIETLLPKERA